MQGSKITAIGDQITTLHVGDILIVSHDLPVQSKITSASLTEPYLALVLSLDLSIVRSLYEQVGPHLREAPDALPGGSYQGGLALKAKFICHDIDPSF